MGPNPNAGSDSPGGIGYGGLNEATTKPAIPSTTKQAVPLLNDQSTGVVGIKNLQLGPDGVLTSSGKEVKLDSGTQLMLQVDIQ